VEESTDRPAVGHRWNGWLLAVGAVVVAAAVLAGSPFLRNSPPSVGSAAVYRAVILPPAVVTTDAATVQRAAAPRFGRGLAISPDGQRLAFVAPDADGRSLLWIRRLDGLSAQPLAGTEGALSPFWSPDGRRIGFVAGGSLKRIDAAGGQAVSLADGVDSFNLGSWNRDDVILFTRRDGIFRVAAAGGDERQVTKSDGSIRHISPFFLPDGKRFLFSGSVLAGIIGRTIYAGSLDSPEPKKIRDGGSIPMYANGHLLFIEDNALMAQPFDLERLDVTGEGVRIGDEILLGGAPGSAGLFAVSAGVIAYQSGVNNRATFVWLDQRGRQQGAPSETRAFGYPQLSPDGRHLAITLREDHDRNRDLWVFDTVRGSRTRVTDNPSDDFAPVWSPDSTQIVYTAMRRTEGDNDLNLYVRNWGTDGSDRRLLVRPGIEIPSSWSADGRFILFQTQSPNADILMLSISDLKVTPFATSRFGETAAKFSPDGGLVAYVSDETGRAEVYVAPVSGAAGRVAVSTEGGAAPRWRNDGKDLFYIRSDDTLMAVSIRASATAIDVGTARALFQTSFQGLGLTTAAYDVTADGRFLVLRDVDEPLPAAITLVINWPAALRKQ
jgi:Tol biopolymer transport system component